MRYPTKIKSYSLFFSIFIICLVFYTNCSEFKSFDQKVETTDINSASSGVSLHPGLTGIYRDSRFGGQGVEVHVVSRGTEVQVYAYVFTHTRLRDSNDNLILSNNNTPYKIKTWFILNGSTRVGADEIDLDIYAPKNGQSFAAANETPDYEQGSPIGVAELSFSSCTNGRIEFTNLNSNASIEDREALLGVSNQGGVYQLERLSPIPTVNGALACGEGEAQENNSNEIIGFGHSGTFTDSNYVGQGIDLFNIQRDNGLQSVAYLYTYETPRDNQGNTISGRDSVRTWFLLDGALEPGTRNLNYTVYDVVDGAPFSLGSSLEELGSASIHMDSCFEANLSMGQDISHPDLAGGEYSNMTRLDPVAVINGQAVCLDGNPQGPTPTPTPTPTPAPTPTPTPTPAPTPTPTPAPTPQPGSCLNRNPSHMTRVRDCNASSPDKDCRYYYEMFGGPFPGQHRGQQYYLRPNQYTAMQFTTTNLEDTSGAWVFETPQPPNISTLVGNRIMTISKCPGDFHKASIEAEMGENCYVKTGFNGTTVYTTVAWKKEGQSGNKCELKLGETYYFNMVYTNDPEGTLPSDLNWSCGNKTDVVCGNNMAPN